MIDEEVIKAAASKLTSHQLEFADLWLNKSQTGLTDVECYRMAYPRCNSDDTASCNAHRLLRYSANVKAYIEAHHQEQTADNIASLTELKEHLTEMARADITEIAQWSIGVDENGNETFVPKTRKFEDVPPDLRRMIKSITYTKQGPKIELYDRQKAIVELAKLQGGYVERVELSGGVVTATTSTEGLTLEEASKNYRALVASLAPKV